MEKHSPCLCTFLVLTTGCATMTVQRLNDGVRLLNFCSNFELAAQPLPGALFCEPLGGDATGEVPEVGVSGPESSAKGMLR
jgi:hypothetical protein